MNRSSRHVLVQAWKPLFEPVEARIQFSGGAGAAPLSPPPTEGVAITVPFAKFSIGDIIDTVKDVVSSFKDAYDNIKNWVEKYAKPLYDAIKEVYGSFKTVLADFKQLIQDGGALFANVVEVLKILNPKSAGRFVDAASAVKLSGGPFRDQYQVGSSAAISKGGATALNAIRQTEARSLARTRDTSALVRSSDPTVWKNYGNAKHRTTEYRSTIDGSLYIARRYVVNGKSATILLRIGA